MRMTHFARVIASVACIVSCISAVAGAAHAQSTGYELAMSGTPVAVPGEHLRWAGTLFEVQALASLRALPQGTVKAGLYEVRQDASRIAIVEQTFTAGHDGRVLIDLEVPSRPLPATVMLVVELGRRGEAHPRRLEWRIVVAAPYRFDLVSDRVRYEPGETIHAFALLRRHLSGAPVSDASVRLAVRNPSGTTIHDGRVSTRASGAIYADVALGTEVPDGTYTIAVTYSGPGGDVSATRSVQVGQRTVERMLLDVEVARPVVPPGAAITGTARVHTASGAPIAGATVAVHAAGNVVTYQSDAEGLVQFSVLAPAFLSGDVETQSIEVRAEHPAYGMRRESKPVVVARSPFQISVVAHGNALVPEVPSRVLVHVTDPLGRPAPSGLELEVSGTSVVGGRQSLRVDADGFAEVQMLVPVGAGSDLGDSGACTGQFGIRFDVTLTGANRMSTSGCAVVAKDAMVSVRATSPVAAPGGEVSLEVARRPAVASQAVIVDVLHERRIVTSVFVAAGESVARFTLPAEISGWVEFRARPLGPHEASRALTEEGGVAYGFGSSDAIFVRPSDAFALTLDAGQDTLPVRGRATVRVHTSSAPTRGFYTMVARDLAQHGGEGDYTIDWLVRFFEAAATSPAETGRENFVRAALAAALGRDTGARGVAPLVQRPWDTTSYGSTNPNQARGELRDPLRIRDDLLRRRAGELMVEIEQLVAQEIGADATDRRFTLRGGGFPPDLIGRMLEAGVASEAGVATLGGRPMTLAMLQSADPEFRFENVAARLCRARLAKLMLSLLAFTNPDNADAARAIEGIPPSRWLSRLVELQMVEPVDLIDPWGRSFVFRPAQGGAPRVVLSDRAPTFELVSAGPDGRAGTGDDVRDPFRRILPQGTPYSVASGEDAIMKAIASLAPAATTLQGMLGAYDTMNLAAIDEQRQSSVSSTPSEEVSGEGYFDDAMMPQAMGSLSGSGSGYGGGAGSARARMVASPSVALGAADSPQMQPPPAPPPAPAGSTLARVGEMIRERFPATLLFVGEHPLEGTDSTIEIPLADALTTYRVEAIAWTASGWVTRASTEFRVDQDATIDAAVPEFATIGDALRVPIRVENRGRTALRVKVGVEAEGLSVDGGQVRTLEVPARGVLEEIMPIRVTGLGSGQLVVRLVRASDDSALDAVRRPLTAYADARLVRETRRFFVEGPATVDVDVAPDASERGPGELRVATGFDFFGELPATHAHEIVDRAWARQIAGLDVSAEDRAVAVGVLAGLLAQTQLPPDVVPYARIVWNDPSRLTRALSVAWGAPSFDAALGRLALERLARDLPETNDRGNPYEPIMVADATRLLGLAPIVRASGPNAEDLALLVGRLRALVENGAARSSDSPAVAVLQAAALANTRGPGRDARADEVIRRLERLVIRSGDSAFLEGTNVGQPHARELPTALLALAYLGQGERAKAFDALVGLATRPERTLADPARVYAAAAAGRLLAGNVVRDPEVRFDGTLLASSNDHGVRTASVAGLGRPGTHHLTIGLPEDGAAWIELDVRYGRPWTGAEARRAPVSISLEGEVGARDTRSGLSLLLRNEGARLLREPVVEIDLPAGAELDEPARVALTAMTRSAPTIEGRTLRLALRAMSPGARIRVPLGLRWTVAGDLRGLGVTAYDATPNVGGVVARAVLPSHLVQLADHGVEPEAAVSETEEPPSPPPPPPGPQPLPVLRTLQPAREVHR